MERIECFERGLLYRSAHGVLLSRFILILMLKAFKQEVISISGKNTGNCNSCKTVKYGEVKSILNGVFSFFLSDNDDVIIT